MAADVYSRHLRLAPDVPLDAALVLLADQVLHGSWSDPQAILGACQRGGLATYGLLLGADIGRLSLRRRHKKELRHALQSWKRKHVRPPSKAEAAALFKLAKDGAACDGPPQPGFQTSLREALSWDRAGSGATVLDLGSDWCDGGSAELHRLYPRAHDEALRALLLVAKRRAGDVDSLWVSLVGRQLAAQGQPPNLAEMQRREADEERAREHRRRVEGV